VFALPFLHNNRLSEAFIYFLPTYTLHKKGRDELYANLRRAALVVGDCIMLWGRGRGENQVMYIRCQCSIIYQGSKVDKVTGILIECTDCRIQLTAMITRTNAMARKVETHYTEPAVYQDDSF
jgi:hypothetical protein